MADKNVVLLKSVIIVRGGKRVSPPIGKAYPLTADELKGMKEGVHYRAAVNEDQDASDAELTPLSNSPHVGKPKTNAQGAGQTSAMVNGADGAALTGEGGQGNDQTDPRLNGTVADVKGVVAEITDKADLAALLAAEEKGQNRTGVKDAINARISALAADDDL